MPSYLNISKDSSSKQYTLTDTFNKPYMHISGSILPLTTNTTNDLHLNIEANNSTYRPLEYGSQSESNTYYTTAVNSEGLSSITALTRSSTSGTSYLTKTESGDVRIYYTESSSYTYRTGGSTVTYSGLTYATVKGFEEYMGIAYASYSVASSFFTNLLFSAARQQVLTVTVNTGTISSRTTSRTYYGSTNRKSLWPRNSQGQQQTSILSAISGAYGSQYYSSKTLSTIFVMTAFSTFGSSTYLYTDTFDIVSANSRSVTTGTSYLTRSSTSGYSGVSSSSSESSGWK